MDRLDLCVVIWYCFNLIIIFPCILYILHQFHNHSDQQTMKYRNKLLVYIINIHALITISIYFGWMSVLRIWQIWSTIPNWSVYIPIGFAVNGSFMLLGVKIWLLYFNQQYHLSIIHLTYNGNNDTNSITHNWFIREKSRFGDAKFLLLSIFTPYLFAGAVMNCIIYSQLGEGPILDLVQSIFVVPCLSFTAYIYSEVQYIHTQNTHTLHTQCIIM